MDLFETLGLGPRQPEENELYVAIYADPSGDAESGGGPGEDADLGTAGAGVGAPAGDDGGGALEDSAAGRLEALRARCTAWMLPYTTDYVWNKDPLVLRTSTRQQPPWARRQRGAGAGTRRAAPEERQSFAASTGGEGCVWSVMRFGDAVDDEWWAVWLLLRMTRELQDLTAQVWDNDGQFLLIEAAYALPRWLKPETADNRVWLRCGRLHVIPLPSIAAPDLPPSPTPAQALAVLREGRYATASPRVQRPIDERLAGYPGSARSDQQHVARCLLPVPLAAALQSEPQLVAELVAAFYYRDADDMRAASRMRVLPPSLDRVPLLVRMTRCHYAQLAQQRFSAPRGVPMPPSDSPMGKAADLGLKLTVAAEIICARQQACADDGGASGAAAAVTTTGQGEPHVSGPGQTAEDTASGPATPALSEARFATDPTWRRFKSSLESNGYFQSNIPGSRRYKELLMGALEAFAAGLAGSGVAADGGGESGSAATSQQRDARRRLSELVRGAAAAGLKAEEFTGHASKPAAEDDDTWLDQQPDRLQSELDRRQAELHEHASRRSGRNDASAAGERAAHQDCQQQVQEVDVDDIASKLRGFMDQLSDLEGVDTTETAHSGDDSGDGVGFDPASFLRELREVLGDDSGPRHNGDAAGELGISANGRSGGEDEDETSTSGDEGSSFFSDEGMDDDEGDEGGEDADEGEVGGLNEERQGFGAQLHPPRPQRQQQQQRQQSRTEQSELELVAGAASGAAAAAEGCGVASQPTAKRPAPPVLKWGFLSGGETASSNRKTAERPAGGGATVSNTRTAAESASDRDLRWEVSTATDSDDDSGSGTSSEAPEEDDADATAKLLAALGVDDGSDGSNDGDRGDAAYVRQSGGIDRTGQQRGIREPVGSAGRLPTRRTSRREAPASADSHGVPAGDNEGFMALYDDVMQAELAGTTLPRSFESGPTITGAAAAREPAYGMPSNTAAGVMAPEGVPTAQALQPVDLDMNLVRNLLRSYTAQQGNAGPAGNMAAMLGLSLVSGDVED